MLLAAASAAAAAYAPSSSVAPSDAAWRRVACSPSMVVAKDVYESYCAQAKPMARNLKEVKTPVVKGAMNGVVAAAAAAGYALMPSSRIPINIVGGALTSTLGLAARKKMASEYRESAPVAVASVLSQGLTDVTPEDLASIGESHGVPRGEFQKQLASLFLLYLSSCLEGGAIELAELAELKRLSTVLRLSPAQIGMQVYEAGRQVYSRHRAYLEDDDDSDPNVAASKKVLSKYIFLAERLISMDESEEGYTYEAMRAQRLFALSADEWTQRAEAAGVPFYEKALDSAVIVGKPATQGQLEAMRGAYGISAAGAERLHRAMYERAIGHLLGADAKLGAADEARLAEVQDLLGIEADAAGPLLVGATAPLYAATAGEVLSAQASAAPLAARQAELLLSDQAARDVERTVVREAAEAKLVEAAAAMRARKTAQAVEIVREVVGACQGTAAFMAEAGLVEGDAAGAQLYSGLVVDGTRESERAGLYRALLLSVLEELPVDAGDEADLALLRAALGLSEAACADVYENAAAPIFRKAVAKAVGGSCSDEEAAELQSSLSALALPAAVTTRIAVEAYEDKLAALVVDEKIINEGEAAQLEALREFLSLSAEDVHPAHEKAFAVAYVNSVKEVLGSGGAIPDEYWEGLASLQARLTLSDEAAAKFFAQAATVKMRELGERALEAMQEQMKAAQAGKGDKEEEGKLGVQAGMIGESLALVEYAVNARVLIQKKVETEDGEKEVDVCGVSLAGQFNSKALNELYRQFLVEAFSGKDEATNQRLFGSLSKLALVLGLDADEVATVHDELGTLMYRRYLDEKLKEQGSVSERDYQFLGSVREALSLPQERCDKLIRELQLACVTNMVEAIVRGGNPDPDDVRKMRDYAEDMEVGLVSDLELSDARLEKLFSVELERYIDTGELSGDDTGALEELCEAYFVSEERAVELLASLVGKIMKDGVLQAAASLRQDAQDVMMEELNKVLKFASVSPAAAECPNVSPTEKDNLYTVYQANSLNDDSAGSLDLLKQVLAIA